MIEKAFDVSTGSSKRVNGAQSGGQEWVEPNPPPPLGDGEDNIAMTSSLEQLGPPELSVFPPSTHPGRHGGNEGGRPHDGGEGRGGHESPRPSGSGTPRLVLELIDRNRIEVAAVGDFDGDCLDGVAERLCQLTRTAPVHLVIDLMAVPVLSPAAEKLFVRVRRSVVEAGGQLEIINDDLSTS